MILKYAWRFFFVFLKFICTWRQYFVPAAYGPWDPPLFPSTCGSSCFSIGLLFQWQAAIPELALIASIPCVYPSIRSEPTELIPQFSTRYRRLFALRLDCGLLGDGRLRSNSIIRSASCGRWGHPTEQRAHYTIIFL